jgi:hypothetical protein
MDPHKEGECLRLKKRQKMSPRGFWKKFWMECAHDMKENELVDYELVQFLIIVLN